MRDCEDALTEVSSSRVRIAPGMLPLPMLSDRDVMVLNFAEPSFAIVARCYTPSMPGINRLKLDSMVPCGSFSLCSMSMQTMIESDMQG